MAQPLVPPTIVETTILLLLLLLQGEYLRLGERAAAEYGLAALLDLRGHELLLPGVLWVRLGSGLRV